MVTEEQGAILFPGVWLYHNMKHNFILTLPGFYLESVSG